MHKKLTTFSSAEIQKAKRVQKELKEYQRVCSLAAKYKNQSESLINVTVKLHYFVKTNTYPKEHSDKFTELTELFDNLETVLRKEKIIK